MPLPRLVARALLPLAVVAALAPFRADAAALPAEEVAALRAEIAALQARLDALEARTAESPVPAAPAPATASASAPAIDAGPGLDIESEDDASSFGIGGRIHYDVYSHNADQAPATGGSEIRRARVQVEGSAAGWGWRMQAELSGRNTDLRDVYLEREFGGGTLTIGQFKPFRSMEELTSSNDITAMERGFGSASGLFADRQWQQGLGWLTGFERGSLGVSAFSLREDNTARNEGWGAAARGTWAPLLESDRLVHFGGWYSLEDGGEDTPGTTVEVAYGGRRGPEALIFESVDGRDFEQRSAGVEFAGLRGGFHWQGEWSRARIAGAAGDGRLEAAYLQAGWLFGGVREYDVGEGVFGSPADIGHGLWEVVARIDRIRLRDADNVEARRFVLGANWYVNEQLRLMLNWTQGKDVSTGDEPSQLALRAQYVF
jgi:phosphate-selective porin OprO/OprP